MVQDMTDQKTSHPLKTIFIGILILNMVVAIISGAVGLYLNWTTAYQYGGGIFIGGIVVVAIGVLSVMGYWKQARNFNYIYAQSMSSEPSNDRNKRAMDESLQRYSSQLIITISGILSLVIGSILQSI